MTIKGINSCAVATKGAVEIKLVPITPLRGRAQRGQKGVKVIFVVCQILT